MGCEMAAELMSVSEWKRSSDAGFFARRNNKLLKQIDWLVEKYHQIDRGLVLQRKACLIAIVGQCNMWIVSKAHKPTSTRMPAVIALRDQAQLVSESSAAQQRWGKLRKLFVGGPKKNSTDVVKPLHGFTTEPTPGTTAKDWNHPINEYWLEAYGDDHIMGVELKQPFERWLELPEGEDRSFWNWLKTQPEYADLKQDRSVAYLDSVARKSYEVRIAGQRLFVSSDGYSLPYDTRGYDSALINSKNSGLAIYVVSPDQKLYAGESVFGKFHHSSFLGGAPVLAAGELRCEDGRLVRITDQSGHYRPSRRYAFNFLLFLRRNRVDLHGIESRINGYTDDAHNHYKRLWEEFYGETPQVQLGNSLVGSNPPQASIGYQNNSAVPANTNPGQLGMGQNAPNVPGYAKSPFVPQGHALPPRRPLPVPPKPRPAITADSPPEVIHYMT